LEEERVAQGWVEFFHYKAMGFYSEQIKRYLNIFGSDNLRIYLYEDLKNNPLSLVREILEFLEIDTGFTPDTSIYYNPSGGPRVRALSHLLKGVPMPLKRVAKTLIPEGIRRKIAGWEMWQNVKPVPKSQISAGTRKALMDYYYQDIMKLQEVLGRDLSHWVKEDVK